MIINITNELPTSVVIHDLAGLTIGVDETIDLVSERPIHDIANSEDLVVLIANEDVSVDDGLSDLSIVDAIKYVTLNEKPLLDVDGKQIVAATNKNFGLRMKWTSRSDSITDVSDVGNGEAFYVEHNVGDPITQTKYADFNCFENETRLVGARIFFVDSYLDELSLEAVTSFATYEMASNTNYQLYGDIIVPSAGTGNINITSDLGDIHTGGMVFFPKDYKGVRPPCFWNAEYDSSEGKYVNITPVPAGDGSFNIFNKESKLVGFCNCVKLLGSNDAILTSPEADKIGQGARIKITTKTFGTDHKWTLAIWAELHRERSII